MECVINGKRLEVCVRKFKNEGVPFLINTVCMIFDVADTTKKGDARRGDMLGRGVAYQSVKDKYDKWTGKKLAFSRALDDAQPDRLRPIWEEHPANPEPSVVLTKQERTQLWSFFKSKFGGKRFNP
jgi:hypothetical protein